MAATLPARTAFARRRTLPAASLRLAVEVAKTSLAYDTNRKAPLYAREGIPELWVADVSGRAVTRF